MIYMNSIISGIKIKNLNPSPKIIPILLVNLLELYIYQLWEKSISDFLYLSRINKDINRASKIVFQTQFASLENSWKTFYTKEFENAQLENNNNSIPLRLKNMKQ